MPAKLASSQGTRKAVDKMPSEWVWPQRLVRRAQVSGPVCVLWEGHPGVASPSLPCPDQPTPWGPGWAGRRLSLQDVRLKFLAWICSEN